jgi:hypothetical protein
VRLTPPAPRPLGSGPQQWEHPDRKHVRDIYAAQQAGFPIYDLRAFGAYRAALTSHLPMDDPKIEAILAPLAQAARAWLDDRPPAGRADDSRRSFRG